MIVICDNEEDLICRNCIYSEKDKEHLRCSYGCPSLNGFNIPEVEENHFCGMGRWFINVKNDYGYSRLNPVYYEVALREIINKDLAKAGDDLPF
jgi:hypothetical protein